MLRHWGRREKWASISLPWSISACLSTLRASPHQHPRIKWAWQQSRSQQENAFEHCRPDCIRAEGRPALAHSFGSTFLFCQVQSTRHMSFPRRKSRLGIRRDDGQSLYRVLTRFSRLCHSPSPVREEPPHGPEMTPYDGPATQRADVSFFWKPDHFVLSQR